MKCPDCGQEANRPGQTFCMGCGEKLPAEQAKQQGETNPHHSQPVKGVSGDLPLCPNCHQTRLIWGTRPNSPWIWVLFAIGVLTIGFCGWVLWLVAIYFLWIQRKPLEPYCPVCKNFAPEAMPH